MKKLNLLLICLFFTSCYEGKLTPTPAIKPAPEADFVPESYYSNGSNKISIIRHKSGKRFVLVNSTSGVAITPFE